MEQLLKQSKKEVGDVSSTETVPSLEEQKEESEPSKDEDKEPVTTPVDELSN